LPAASTAASHGDDYRSFVPTTPATLDTDGNGELSHLGHLRPGSVQVAVGHKVRAGQPIAQVGTSGSSLFPHLHYQLVTRPTFDAEGLPSPLVEFDRVLGSTRARADGTSPDSGDIVEAR
jgi:hypothetical protein